MRKLESRPEYMGIRDLFVPVWESRAVENYAGATNRISLITFTFTSIDFIKYIL